MNRAAAQVKKTDRPIPVGVVLAHFAWCYPGTPLMGAWPTRDGVIPWTLFWQLYGAMPHVMALKRITEAHAVALGTALANGSSDAAAAARRDADEAYPAG